MLTKIMNFAKMSWMLIWRLTLLSFFLFGNRYTEILILAALIASGISVFIFNKVLTIWPLVKLVQRKPAIVPAHTWGGEKAPEPTFEQPKRRPEPVSTPYHVPAPAQAPVLRLGSASENGRITGLEPSALASRPVPRTPTMIGEPGSSLHSMESTDHSGSMGKEAVSLGVKGEENFARVLAATGYLHRFGTIWSVPVPDQERAYTLGPFNTDIDCVLATGSTIFLIDLKNYKSGNVRYYAQGADLYCEDVPTGKLIGEVKTMSHNMQMAAAAIASISRSSTLLLLWSSCPLRRGRELLTMWSGPEQSPP